MVDKIMKRSQGGRSCLICGKRNGRHFLCETCRKDPFLVEDARSIMATERCSEVFTRLYGINYAEIKNKNSQTFWDNEFKEEIGIESQDPMTKEKIATICSLIPEGSLKILDLGFGQGYFEEVFLHNRRKTYLTGVDISKKAVQKAKGKFKGKYIHGNILSVKKLLPKNRFDVIIMIEVIEHISPKNVLKFLSDINGLLKKNGIIIISTPLNEHLRESKNNRSGHVRDYSINTLMMEFDISGFEIKNYYTFYAFNKLYNFKKFIAKVFPNKWEPNNIVLLAIKR